ncbi:hypothetical protein AMS59_08125 [Lysinibacillus sp. FJAT-14745]|nr:hypothetical protein AMS59_08125 [Lysinibacillus sp. FJAT-14745]
MLQGEAPQVRQKSAQGLEQTYREWLTNGDIPHPNKLCGLIKDKKTFHNAKYSICFPSIGNKISNKFMFPP